MSVVRATAWAVLAGWVLSGAQAMAKDTADASTAFEAARAQALVEARAVKFRDRPWLERTDDGRVVFDFGPLLATPSGEPLPDPRAHVQRALVHLVLLSRAMDYGQIEPLDGLKDALSKAAVAGLEELRTFQAVLDAEQQPPGAMADAAMFAEGNVRARVLDALWTWARTSNIALYRTHRDTGSPMSEELLTPDHLDAIAREFPEPVTFGSEVGEGMYQFGRLVPTPDDAPLAAAFVRAYALVHGLERLQASMEPDMPAPAFDRLAKVSKALVLASLAQSNESKNGRRARALRAEQTLFQVRAAAFQHTWAWATENGFALFPIAEVDRRPPPPFAVSPTTGQVTFAAPVADATPQYETREERVLVRPAGTVYRKEEGRWRAVEVPATYKTVTRQVRVGTAVERSARPGLRMKSKTTAFGSVLHVWFLDKWTWRTKPKWRPEPNTAWDDPDAHPPTESPWVDLVYQADIVMGRRQHRMPGYVIVVGSRGACGPIEVDLMSESVNKIFDHCSRKR